MKPDIDEIEKRAQTMIAALTGGAGRPLMGSPLELARSSLALVSRCRALEAALDKLGDGFTQWLNGEFVVDGREGADSDARDFIADCLAVLEGKDQTEEKT